MYSVRLYIGCLTTGIARGCTDTSLTRTLGEGCLAYLGGRRRIAVSELSVRRHVWSVGQSWSCRPHVGEVRSNNNKERRGTLTLSEPTLLRHWAAHHSALAANAGTSTTGFPLLHRSPPPPIDSHHDPASRVSPSIRSRLQSLRLHPPCSTRSRPARPAPHDPLSVRQQKYCTTPLVQ